MTSSIILTDILDLTVRIFQSFRNIQITVKCIVILKSLDLHSIPLEDWHWNYIIENLCSLLSVVKYILYTFKSS